MLNVNLLVDINKGGCAFIWILKLEFEFWIDCWFERNIVHVCCLWEKITSHNVLQQLLPCNLRTYVFTFKIVHNSKNVIPSWIIKENNIQPWVVNIASKTSATNLNDWQQKRTNIHTSFPTRPDALIRPYVTIATNRWNKGRPAVLMSQDYEGVKPPPLSTPKLLRLAGFTGSHFGNRQSLASLSQRCIEVDRGNKKIRIYYVKARTIFLLYYVSLSVTSSRIWISWATFRLFAFDVCWHLFSTLCLVLVLVVFFL